MNDTPRRRRPRVFDSARGDRMPGEGIGMGFVDPDGFDWGDPIASASNDLASDWVTTADPDIVKKIVPTGTQGATAAGATSVLVNFPKGYDTWAKPTDAAYRAGRQQAAIDTISATVDQVASAAGKVGDIGATLLKNFWPIAIGVAALYFFSQQNKRGY